MLIIRYTRIFAVNLQETAGTNKQAIIKKCSELLCSVSITGADVVWSITTVRNGDNSSQTKYITLHHRR